MALTRAKKTEKVEKLAGELAGSTSAIIGTFKALTADKDFDLRKAVRGAGGHYHVVKNKLAPRAAEGTQIADALKGLKGVSSVAYTSGDPVALAEFVKPLKTSIISSSQAPMRPIPPSFDRLNVESAYCVCIFLRIPYRYVYLI